MENILINFQSDTTGLEPGIDGLVQLEVQDKKVEAQAKKTATAIQERDKQISKGAAASKTSIESLAGSVNKLDKNIAGGTWNKVLTDLRNQFTLTDKEAKKFYENVIRNSRAEILGGKKTQEEIKAFNQLIGEAQLELDRLLKQEEKTSAGTQSLRTRLMEAKKELTAMAEAGLRGTPAFEALRQKAGQLDDELRDLNQDIKNVGSDTKNIEGLIGIMGGAVGVFSVAQGATALFGDENEELQRALLKVNAAMSILNGIQAIQTVLLKESAATELIVNARKKIALAVTYLQTAAESQFTVVRYGAIAAQKLLNLVMLASPAGILAVVIGTLAGAMLYFTSNAKDAAKAQTQLNDALDAGGKYLDADLKGLENTNKRVIASLKARGATDKEITDQEILNNELKIASRRKALDQVQKDLNDTKLLNKLKEGDLPKLQALESQLQADITDTITENISIRAEAQRKNLDEQNSLNEKQREKEKQRREKQLADAKKYADSERKAVFDGLQLDLNETIRVNELISGNENNTLKQRLDAVAEAYNAKQNLLLNQKNYEIENGKLTATETKNVIKKFGFDSNALHDQLLKDRNDIIKTANEKDLEEYRKSFERINKIIQDGVKDTNSGFTISAAKELLALDQEFNAGRIKSVEDYESRKKAKEDRFRAEKLRNEIRGLQQEAAVALISGRDSLGLQEQIANKEIELSNLVTQAKISNDAKQAKSAEDAAQVRIQKEQYYKEIATTLANGLFDNQKARYDNEAAANKELFDKKLISEREYNQRTRDAKRQQANADKQKALFDIFIQTGVNIVKSFSNPILVALAVALGAIQAGLVASRPIPQFYKGSKRTPPGWKWVGEQGAELIYDDGGYPIIPHNKSKQLASKNYYDPQIMNEYNIPVKYNVDLPDINDRQKVLIEKYNSSSTQIDYDRLGKSVAMHVGKITDLIIPGTDVNIDETGIHIMVKKGLETIEFQNKRYSTK